MSDDGPRCICGQLVAVPHQECMALLTPKQRHAYKHGRPIPADDDPTYHEWTP